ncbi:CinA family protein [Dyadobacter psychrotolerans]|uniref:CinA family protein n=1 Tax=Dyadobacter psychrotolerans TaxID=2541721 RepID=A0A4R5DQM0_9BACT|nr:CinA family protein [Dyadobacter psychrotolerans]TDE14480.1 CinA family protein [Dyadobacter psychrotolerans]
MPSQLVIDCSKIIKEHNLTIAFAESATAGRLASEFSLTPDSGAVLKGGLVCYDACLKEDILMIPKGFVDEFTPESAEVTKEMALRLKKFIESGIQVATTGLPSPGGSETKEKPVGTMFSHILIGESSIAIHRVFEGTPEEIILQSIDQVAETIMNELKENNP